MYMAVELYNLIIFSLVLICNLAFITIWPSRDGNDQIRKMAKRRCEDLVNMIPIHRD